MKAIFTIISAVIGAVCLVYGTTVKGVGSGNRFWLVWWLMAAFFAALSAALRFGLLQKLPKPLLATAGAVAAAGVLIVLVLIIRMLSCFHAQPNERVSVLIVLGAQVTSRGPSIILQHRLDTAADYLLENPETVCIVTGAQGPNEPATEAEVMRDYLVAVGVDASRIRMETEAVNTIGNIRNCMEMIDPENDTVGIVTNDFHLFRALSIAKKQGIRHVSGIAAPSRAFFYPHNLLRECVGYMKDLVMGNL